MFVLSIVKARRGIRSPGPGVIDVCEPLAGYWEPKLGPLKEQQGFLKH